MEALDKLPNGNLDPEAAMARIRLIRDGPPPADGERFEVVSLMDNSEV